MLTAGLASACATMGRARAASWATTPSQAPEGIDRVSQIASAAARDASSTATCFAASVRTSLATVEAPLEPWMETTVRSAFFPSATAAL